MNYPERYRANVAVLQTALARHKDIEFRQYTRDKTTPSPWQSYVEGHVLNIMSEFIELRLKPDEYWVLKNKNTNMVSFHHARHEATSVIADLPSAVRDSYEILKYIRDETE